MSYLLTAAKDGISTFVGNATAAAGSVPLMNTRPVAPAKEIQLSEHNFREFGDLFSLNDRITQELSDSISDEDIKKYDLNAPRVIVVGLTSAGKSSLLERVIGHPIFPVRDNVCTRRPFAVHLRNDPSVPEGQSILRFTSGTNEGKESKEKDRSREYTLPADIDKVRRIIEIEQKSEDDSVEFSIKEIHAEIRSSAHETFTFTDLPGIFLVSEKKMGADYAKSRQENERLKTHTMDITKAILTFPLFIVVECVFLCRNIFQCPTRFVWL
jgi:hypothetical protein